MHVSFPIDLNPKVRTSQHADRVKNAVLPPHARYYPDRLESSCRLIPGTGGVLGLGFRISGFYEQNVLARASRRKPAVRGF